MNGLTGKTLTNEVLENDNDQDLCGFITGRSTGIVRGGSIAALSSDLAPTSFLPSTASYTPKPPRPVQTFSLTEALNEVEDNCRELVAIGGQLPIFSWDRIRECAKGHRGELARCGDMTIEEAERLQACLQQLRQYKECQVKGFMGTSQATQEALEAEIVWLENYIQDQAKA